jgi:putative transposase
MKVGRSAYYEYRAGRSYQLSEKKEYLAEQVKEAFKDNRRRYGARRLVPELRANGIEIGRYQVRALMKMQGLEAVVPKRYVPKTTTPDNLKASPNLLNNDGNGPDGPGKVIIGDITYLPMANGKFCYLGSFQDKFTRRIIHTDRGSQYSSNNFRGVLKEEGLRQSMSGKGNCYDNAQAESFFARYKIELLEGGQFENVSEAISETFAYIEGYYNRTRRHSSLGYLSPANFEKMFRENQQRRN